MDIFAQLSSSIGFLLIGALALVIVFAAIALTSVQQENYMNIETTHRLTLTDKQVEFAIRQFIVNAGVLIPDDAVVTIGTRSGCAYIQWVPRT